MFKPIRPKRVTHEIVVQIQELMGSGALRPGSRLPPEREMAQQLGVSRPTLREAMGILEHLGLVQSVQGNGTYVMNVAERCLRDPLQELILSSERRMVELAEFRTEVESWAVALAAERIEPQELKLLEEILEQMKLGLQQGKPIHHLDADFHLSLARATHNGIYYHVANTIFYLFAEVTRVSHERIFRSPKEKLQLLEEHEAIYQAVAEAKGEKARKLMREHLGRTEEWFKKTFGEQDSRRRNEKEKPFPS
ncbi:MAG: FadR/GntR family transcriptional regulator [bacterium]